MAQLFFPKRFLATTKSIDAARQISDVLGAPFDADATRQAADDLHEEYFRLLRAVLAGELDDISFCAGSRYRVNAFVTGASDTVYFDEFLDIWLFTCSHLTTVAACKSLAGDEYQALIEYFQLTLDMTRHPTGHYRLQDELLTMMLQHADCLELSHALSRAMIIFTICHECADLKLGHTAARPQPHLEFEADQMAIRYFLRVSEAGTNAGMIFIHEKLLCAPLLLFRFFELAEMRAFSSLGHLPSRQSHPSPRNRLNTIAAHLERRLTPGSKYIHDGFMAALSDVERLAEFQTPPNLPEPP